MRKRGESREKKEMSSPTSGRGTAVLIVKGKGIKCVSDALVVGQEKKKGSRGNRHIGQLFQKKNYRKGWKVNSVTIRARSKGGGRSWTEKRGRAAGKLGFYPCEGGKRVQAGFHHSN